MSEETKNLRNRIKKAAVSIEISLTMVMAVVGAILILSLFGHNLASAFTDNAGFNEHFSKTKNIAASLLDNNSNFAQTQINVAVTASQGIKFDSEKDVAEWSSSTLANVLNLENPAQYDLEKAAKAAAVAENLVGVRYVANGKTLSEIEKILNTDKYGNIFIDYDKNNSIIINLNNKKIEIYDDFPNKLALFNAIYNAKFE